MSIGDTHFSDAAIMAYEQRPFETLYEMNIEIVNRWNSLVKPEDTIFHLGDLSAQTATKCNIQRMVHELNGHKQLILGNHDTWDEEDYKACGFEHIYEYPIIIDGFFILSHEPIYMVQNSPYVNIHAHVHGNLAYKNYSKTSYCASVERTEYSPIALDTIKETIELARNK